MSPNKPSDYRQARARAWSPETETREDVKALLRRRSALTPSEVLLFRSIYPDIYDAYVGTLRCVVRSRGARGAVEMELVHEALTAFWDECVARGFPESIQARLVGLASGEARNACAARAATRRPRPCPPPARSRPGASPRTNEGSI